MAVCHFNWTFHKVMEGLSLWFRKLHAAFGPQFLYLWLSPWLHDLLFAMAQCKVNYCSIFNHDVDFLAYSVRNFSAVLFILKPWHKIYSLNLFTTGRMWHKPSYPFPRLIALTKVKRTQSVLIFTHSWMEMRRIHAFPRNSSTKWNANKLVQDLISDI